MLRMGMDATASITKVEWVPEKWSASRLIQIQLGATQEHAISMRRSGWLRVRKNKDMLWFYSLLLHTRRGNVNFIPCTWNGKWQITAGLEVGTDRTLAWYKSLHLYLWPSQANDIYILAWVRLKKIPLPSTYVHGRKTDKVQGSNWQAEPKKEQWAHLDLIKDPSGDTHEEDQ